jgi:hypothetical protein
LAKIIVDTSVRELRFVADRTPSLMPKKVAIISDVEARVRDDWYRVARRVGVTERDCDAISGAFCYPGFRLPVLAE